LQKWNNRKCYGLALSITIFYTIIACKRSDYPTQGIGILFTILILDISMYLVLRGNLSWSAGYISLIMGLCRVCLAATCGKYWLLGQTLMYMIFGVALCREIVGRNLPRMSPQEAGGVTFFGHEYNQEHQLDISATPEFSLGFLSFFYIFLLVGVAFTEDSNTAVKLPVFGQHWPLWVFGVLSFAVVLFTGIDERTTALGIWRTCLFIFSIVSITLYFSCCIRVAGGMLRPVFVCFDEVIVYFLVVDIFSNNTNAFHCCLRAMA